MLLASQTTAANPTVWVCHAAIAERLRCSTITVKRAIQKLVEAKLIVETGDLHERRYKFYRIRWALDERVMAPQTKRKKVVTKAQAFNRQAVVRRKDDKDWMPACAGMTKEADEPIAPPTLTEHVPAPPAPPLRNPIPTADQLSMLKDSTLAHYAELARQKHLEYLRRYNIDPTTLR